MASLRSDLTRLRNLGFDVLSPAALRVYAAFRRLAKQKGRPAAVREVAAALGLCLNGVQYHIRRLRAAGLLPTEPPRKARRIVARWRWEAV